MSEISAFLGRTPASSQEAVELLVAFQRENHPDRFQDHEAQQEATKRFATASGLVARIRGAIERSYTSEATTTAIEVAHSGDLALTRSRLEVSSLLDQTADLRRKLSALRYDNSKLRDQNNELREQLRPRLDSRLERAQEKVTAPYRPTPKNIKAAGFSAALALLFALLAQVETLYAKVLSPLGLASQTAGLGLFAIFALTSTFALHRYLKSQFLAKAARHVVTTPALRRFVQLILREQEKKEIEFTETDVVEFLIVELRPASFLDQVARLFGLRGLSSETLDDLKDVALLHMLQSGLVEAGPSHLMERLFRVKQRPNYVQWSDLSKLMEFDPEVEETDEDDD